VVTASATYSPASSRLSTTYDPKHVAVLAQASASGPGYGSSVTQNGVGRAVTRSSTPGGQIQLMTVAVVVDSALRPAPNLATIGKQVSAALGLKLSRGDRLSVVALPMPGARSATGPASAQPSGPARVTPYLRPGLGVAVATVLLATLMTDAVAGRRRKRRTGSNPALV
jgi:flagellar biosynthesis/type III secretory pathway M-ring protein FliF/YscJ